ncbi:hypothetical protein R6V09_30665 [Streptomyces sp. W16]|uniref:hypothetical protein n=1 Tax=Streptomyces sp. W16 TaxID=3076631 RepID=UPI00295A7B45|nr:hypothetical protein [Streptomyces sp. W16]MDV9174458.1 hypothetical protein [Streptomyces sp. W16]
MLATPEAENCPKQPLGEVSAKQVTCEHDGVVIHLIADTDKVGRAIPRKAAEAVHRPDDAELAALLPALTTRTPERTSQSRLPTHSVTGPAAGADAKGSAPRS